MAEWRRIALDPPYAHAAPLGPALLRSKPEDFCVAEQLSFTPSGNGRHWLLRVEKRAANTQWVATEIARRAAVPAAEVGYAGLKDRHALAVQWFSVPDAKKDEAFWLAQATSEFRVLTAIRNERKLKRGALTGNRFKIVLRGAAFTTEQAQAKLATISTHGVPNYFGPQRFGRNAANLDALADWIDSGHAPRGRAARGFALSTARALIFNALLARRVAANDWAELAPGDLASLDGSGSFFIVDAVDEVLANRLATFDVHPSGPLWGRGQTAAGGAAKLHESAVAVEQAAVAELLQREGLTQERRPLRAAVRDIAFDQQADVASIEFSLGRGQFATAVLRELCEIEANAEPLESDEVN
jgi:tRNA pseudouridine13 synthase